MKFFKLIATLLILVLCGGGFIVFTDTRAKANAEQFCNFIQPGTSTSSLAALAVDYGARIPPQPWLSTSGTNTILVARFTGVDPLYGHQCTITAKNGLVISKELMALDP
jgi:hypothetical protein